MHLLKNFRTKIDLRRIVPVPWWFIDPPPPTKSIYHDTAMVIDCRTLATTRHLWWLQWWREYLCLIVSVTMALLTFSNVLSTSSNRERDQLLLDYALLERHFCQVVSLMTNLQYIGSNGRVHKGSFMGERILKMVLLSLFYPMNHCGTRCTYQISIS